MIGLVREHLIEKGYMKYEATNVRLRFSASSYTLGYVAPILADVTQNCFILLPKNLLRITKGIVAEVGFYASDEVRIDDEMVQEENKDESFTQEKFILIWFAKALALLRFYSDGGRIGLNVNRPVKTMNKVKSMNEYCFVQNFKVLP